jgi:hypothetical protein
MYFIYKYIINATTTAINACKKKIFDVRQREVIVWSRGKIEKSFSSKLTDYFIQGMRNKRLCDSNAHVTPYGTVSK